MAALIQVACPNCGSENVVRRGKSADGKQRYLCQNGDCETKSLMTDYKYNGKKSGKLAKSSHTLSENVRTKSLSS